MKLKSRLLRAIHPVVTPRSGIRIGSAIKIGTETLLEVKYRKKTDYITTVELVELIERKKVSKILFLGSIESAG
jgi:hypothetical protein